MSRPVVEIEFPSELVGLRNGELPPHVLVEVDDDGNLLERHAAAAWHAMVAACFAATGKKLKIGNSYRMLEGQIRIFLDRYVLTYDPLTTTSERVVWNGKTYYKRRGQNTAARPGSSNHGWGLSVDTDDESTYDPDIAAWLLEHAVAHGFSWEEHINCAPGGSCEPWHLRYFAGDHPPIAPTPTTPEDDDMGNVEWRILQPAGSTALFIAPMAPFPDGSLGALSATWLPTPDKVAVYEARGVTRLPLGVEDLRNVQLLGPLPHGDVREWTSADFLATA